MNQETDRTISFELDNFFGKYRLYPKNEMAANLCRMMKTKTFLERNLKYLNLLGFTVTIDEEIVKDFK